MVIPNYIVMDWETGGLSPLKNPVVELAAIALDGATMKEIARYEAKIKPYNPALVYAPQAMEIHGLSVKELEQRGEEAKDVVKGFKAFAKTAKGGKRAKPVAVGHNLVGFDNGFTIAFFNEFGVDITSVMDLKNSIDTMRMAMLKFNEAGSIANHKLPTVCEASGVTLNNAHRAMNDVEANAELFIEYVNLLHGSGTTTKKAVKKVKFRETFVL